MGGISRRARGGKRRRRGKPSVALAVSLAVALWLVGCPARRPGSAAGTPGDEVGPPSVLDPTLLDRG